MSDMAGVALMVVIFAVFVGIPVVLSERRRFRRERPGAEFERYRAGMERATARAREMR